MRKPKPASEDVETAEVSRIGDVGLNFDPDPFNARGDCRDAMLAVLRTSADWSKFNEQQQRDINAQVDQTAETIIAKLVRAIAAEGGAAVRAKVEQLTVKDGLKLQLTALHDHDTVVLLGDLVGKWVSLVAADAEAFGHQRGPAQVDVDQPELLTGDEGGGLVDAVDPPALDEAPALDEGSEVVTGLSVTDGTVVKSGDIIQPVGTNSCEARVNLKTSMVQGRGGATDDDADWFDVREATPDELAAERERTADFVDA